MSPSTRVPGSNEERARSWTVSVPLILDGTNPRMGSGHKVRLVGTRAEFRRVTDGNTYPPRFSVTASAVAAAISSYEGYCELSCALTGADGPDVLDGLLADLFLLPEARAWLVHGT